MIVQHAGLTAERWSEFAFPRRILMIANEPHRASQIHQPESADLRAVSLERVLALLDLTIAIERRDAALHELLRFRDCVAAAYIRHPDAPSDRALLRCLLYFHPESAAQIPYIAA